MYIDLLVMRMIDDDSIIKNVKKLSSDKEKVEYLIKEGITKENIVKKAEDYFGVEYIDLSNINITKNIIGSFNMEQLRSNKIIPYGYRESDKTYLIASSNLSKSREIVGVTNFLKSNGFDTEFKFSFEFEILDKLNSLNNAKGVTDYEIMALIEKTIMDKPEGHRFMESITDYEEHDSMVQIGG